MIIITYNYNIIRLLAGHCYHTLSIYPGPGQYDTYGMDISYDIEQGVYLSVCRDRQNIWIYSDIYQNISYLYTNITKAHINKAFK